MNDEVLLTLTQALVKGNLTAAGADRVLEAINIFSHQMQMDTAVRAYEAAVKGYVAATDNAERDVFLLQAKTAFNFSTRGL